MVPNMFLIVALTGCLSASISYGKDLAIVLGEGDIRVQNSIQRHGWQVKKNLLKSLGSASKELSQGDQLLIVWDTHGAEPLDSSHEIRDRLEKLQRRGVRIGIVDDSHYGGASILAFDDLACVLSGTTNFQKLPSAIGAVGGILGVLEGGFRADQTLPSQRGSLEDALLYRILIGKERRTPKLEYSADVQSSSFLSWFGDVYRQYKRGLEPRKRLGLLSEQPGLEQSYPDRCKALAYEALQSFLIVQGQKAAASEAIIADLLLQTFDEEKCLAYLKHRDEVLSGSKDLIRYQRFHSCDALKL